MNNKIALITGATNGIGKQTAISLAKLDYQVIITERNKESGEKAVKEIQQLSGNSKIDLFLSDISTQAGIHSLANQLKQKYERLDVLINNAGLASPERELTQDGIESNFAVNVIAPFLLTRLLMDVLRLSFSARVVSVAGGKHPSKIELDNLQAERKFDGLNSYSHSKTIMMAVMYEFAQQTKGTNVTSNICYPGQASTTMTQSVTPEMLPKVMLFLFPLFKLAVRSDGSKSAEKASRSSVYLASSLDVEGISGKYFNSKCKDVNLPKVVLNQTTRTNLWEYVERLLNNSVKI